MDYNIPSFSHILIPYWIMALTKNLPVKHMVNSTQERVYDSDFRVSAKFNRDVSLENQKKKLLDKITKHAWQKKKKGSINEFNANAKRGFFFYALPNAIRQINEKSFYSVSRCNFKHSNHTRILSNMPTT